MFTGKRRSVGRSVYKLQLISLSFLHRGSDVQLHGAQSEMLYDGIFRDCTKITTCRVG